MSSCSFSFFQELLLFIILSGFLALFHSFRSYCSLLFFHEFLLFIVLSGVIAVFYSFRSYCSLLFFHEKNNKEQELLKE
jgi:predicted membrane protein